MPRWHAWLLVGALLGSLMVGALEATVRPPRSPAVAQSARLSRLVPEVRIPTPPPPAPPPLRTVTLTGLMGSNPITIAPFDAEGRPLERALALVREHFRPRGGEAVDIDPRLVALLLRVSMNFDGKPITIVSGHREAGRGTSRTSYHVRGMAADIAIEGVRTLDLYRKVLDLGEARGVGYYPHFVHVDVRDDAPYRWGGGGRRAIR